MSKRSSQLEMNNMISIIEKVEICGLLGGIKSIVRICREVRDLKELRRCLEGLNLSLVSSDVIFVKELESSSEQIYGFASPASSQANGLPIWYVVRSGEERLAQELSRLEIDNGSDNTIGELLGIPSCCVVQYENIRRRFNWIDVMLEATDLDKQCFVACNQFAREYLGVVIKPDYFPCSFQCEKTRLIAALYSDLIEEYISCQFRTDLELLCSKPVEVGQLSSLITGGIDRVVPAGSMKFDGSRLLFS